MLGKKKESNKGANLQNIVNQFENVNGIAENLAGKYADNFFFSKTDQDLIRYLKIEFDDVDKFFKPAFQEQKFLELFSLAFQMEMKKNEE